MTFMDRIHPKLTPYVEALRSHEFGLQGEQAKIENIECGSIVAKKERRWGDRFHLRILYCNKRLSWQVLMCPNNLREPPDFIMEDDFLADADHNLIVKYVPSLAHWEPSDPKCLLNVVLELLDLYREFQSEILRINRESRLCLEYELLMHSYSNAAFSDVEIYVHNPGRVSFLLHLNVDFSKLPVPLPKQKYHALLLVELAENAKNVVSLTKYRELCDIFGDINLPEFSCHMVLVEYARRVEDYLQSMVDEIVHSLIKRKMLYCYLVQALEPAFLNGDNIQFESVSFLLESNNEYYVLHIVIPLSFPKDPPELNISSMRRSKGATKFFVPLKKLQFDSRWGIDKIFRNVFEYIKNGAIPQYNKFLSNPDGKPKK